MPGIICPVVAYAPKAATKPSIAAQPLIFSASGDMVLMKYKANIIACSLREPANVIEWLSSGAHIVTVPPSYLDKMIVHPYSKETIQMFLSDAEKLIK